MRIDELIAANNLVEDFKSAVLENTIITLRDSETHELLYSCHTGENYGWLSGKDIDVEQDINLHAVLANLKMLEGGTDHE